MLLKIITKNILKMNKLIKLDIEWKEMLNPLQFEILRKKGTEKPFTSLLLNEKRKGFYHCAACDNKLFNSDAKFDSGTGWPSFSRSIENSVIIQPYFEEGLDGAEVLCWKCEGHLGHLFLDGPEPTGKRFCINGAVLVFKEK
jgi:peptide-methionine (R)-S-oxide reductase